MNKRDSTHTHKSSSRLNTEEKSKIKAAIFDMDGTLLDTIEDIGFSVNEVLEIHAFPTHTMGAYKKMVGRGIEYLLRSALPPEKRDGQDFMNILQELKSVYSKNLNAKSRVYEGINDLLDFLKHQGISLGIFTNKPGPMARRCVDEYFGRWSFETVGAGEAFPVKPDPKGALFIAESLGVKPENCLFIGDSDIDIFTAKNAGMVPVGVLWGFRGEKELREAGAELILSKPIDLMDSIITKPDKNNTGQES